MGRKATQFRLLLWKNYILQKRKILVTILEIGLPTFFALILIFIRGRVIATEVPTNTTWNAFSVDTFPDKFLHIFSPDPKLAYAPNSTLTRDLMAGVLQDLNEGLLKVNRDALNISFPPGMPPQTDRRIGNNLNMISTENINATGFATEDKMVEFLMSSKIPTGDIKKSYIGGIVFLNVDADDVSLSKNISYKIRLSYSPRNDGSNSKNPFKSDTRWNTEYTYPILQQVGPREKGKIYGGQPGYMREGFLTIQHAINKAVIRKLNMSANTKEMDIYLQRQPYPPYNDDLFVLVLQSQLPLIIMLSFVFSALNVVKDVVHEKERKLKESLKMMGVGNWLHWMAWFVKYFIFLLISVAIITLFLCIKINKKSAIGMTDPSIIFIFLMVYAISTISFCFAVSVFFSKANSAAAAGGILFFISYIPYFFLQPRYDTLPWFGKILPCLINNVAMAFGGQVIGMFEGTGSGVTWNNIHRPVSVDDDFTMLHVLFMLIVDSVLYGLITWYVEAVFPGEYGIPQRWYFPFLKSYWCGVKVEEDDNEETPLLSSRTSDVFEKAPIGLNAGVKLRNLRKEFSVNGTKKAAVAGTTLDMYEGQITALLGHNGAGKTTTMSMLTGFIPPTSGTAIVNGFDIKEDIQSVRNSLGLCPQHDVLFDILTVDEHMHFFAKLKGYPSEKVPDEVTRMLTAVGLDHKRDALSKTLSGGQKRKLSVAMALIGDSKIIILDEPSSGMDPSARRHIWEVLQNHRAGRTMILSTHFMDEADLLGDRIAIMADGVIQCYGTPLFLKTKYGAGYHMVIVKLPSCNVQQITDVVHKHIPSAAVESNISAELAYILPQNCSDKFENLFTELEQNRDELGIGSFGASVTTMEEVFIRVGEGSDDTIKTRLGGASYGSNGVVQSNGAANHQDKQLGQLICSSSVFSTPIMKNSGISLYLQQFFAMFLKRVLNTSRNWVVTIAQLAVPLFFTIAALIVVKTMPSDSESPALNLTLAKFSDPVVTYSSGINSTALSQTLAKHYISQFKDQYKTRYVNNISECEDDILVCLLQEANKSIANYNDRYIISGMFKELYTNVTKANITAFFNNQPYHTPPITLDAVDNALLGYYVNDSYRFEVTNHPLPRTTTNRANDIFSRGTVGFSIAFNVLFGMSFLASSFVLFIVKERAIKAKHVQFVSGVHSLNFWASTFAWDLINFLIPCTCLLVTFAAFDIEAYSHDGRLGNIFLLFVLYAWAMLPFMYLLSFIFTVPSTGLVWLTMFNILSGIATMLAVDILSIPQLMLQDLAKVLEWIFMVLLPNFCLGEAVQTFYENYENNQLCSELSKELPFNLNLTFFCDNFVPFPQYNLTEFPCCKGKCGDNCLDFQTNYLAWEPAGIGRMLVFLAIQGLFYFTIVFLIESEILHSIRYVGQNKKVVVPTEVTTVRPAYVSQMSLVVEDSDVAEERERIVSGDQCHTLVLNEVTKYFGQLTAVDHISVGISSGECFGLLGINGAGKTTTFKMLTGDEYLSEGDAFLNGYNVKTQITSVQQSLGYCPQFDALIDLMTGRETLYMYARLRGVVEWQIKKVVWEVICSLLLEEHADKLVKNYSGGNKRKLSTAIALIGDPPIVFLDEPSTGMDPVARRILWGVLSNVRDSGRTLVLTSHSMEECEALCTRIAIMVNGVFKCLGSTQHLKSKFGKGYTLMAKVRHQEDGSPPNLEPLMRFIENKFANSVLKDIHQELVHYHITDTSVSWAQVFGTMEHAKKTFNIEDYSVSQTTLEQVFINFARSQVPPSEHAVGCCTKCSMLCGSCCQ